MNLKIKCFRSDGHFFITSPKIFSLTGLVPYALGVQRSYEFDDPVYPFPSFKDNHPPNGIISAISAVIDKCDRLWILDQVTPSLVDTVIPQRIGLFAYSLSENRMIYRIRFPLELTYPGPNDITNLVIDDYHGCENIKAIISDTFGYCVYVFDYRSERFWKVQHQSMKNDPRYSTFQYKNASLHLPSGIYSISLSPPLGKSRERYLFYGPYAGITKYVVPLSILYREELWTKGISLWRTSRSSSRKTKKTLKNTYRSIDVNRYFQEVARSESLIASYCDIDLEQAIYYCVLPRMKAVSAWKITKPFSTMSLIVKNKEVYKNGVIEVVKNVKGEQEIIITTTPFIVSRNNFQKLT